MPDSNSSHNPLGSLPINTLLPKFAIPSIVAYLVTSLYNIVDQIFIGQGVGYLGNAATNVAFPFTTVSTAIALMMGIGTAANFNLNLGAGNEERARRVAGTGLSCLALFSLTLGLIALFFRGPLLNLFGATPEVLPYAMIYTGITAFGLPMVTFTTGASSLVRADGSPTYSMLCTLSGAVLNTILDPVFIFGLDMGVAGGALATVLGQALSLVMVLYYPFRTRIRTIRLTAASLHPSGPLLRAICSLGVSPFLNQMAMFLVQITLNNTLTYYGALSHYGEDIPLACVGVISKVNILMLGFTLGISQGCQPIFSYNYGARQYSRVREAYRKAIVAASVICCICNGIFNHTSLCQFYQGRLLLQVTIPFEEKPTSNLPGDNLRYYRQRKSLTTRQLAEQIDVVPATILMYEQNKHPIPFDVANSLADALDVNADLLYDDFAVFLVTPYSEALKDIRMSIGMSQRAFAEHIGVIPSYYYKLESGHRRPSRKVYQRMVDTLSHTHPHHSLFAQHKL